MGLEKGTSRFSYSGTLKKSVCTRCNKDLNGMSAEEADTHARECVKQKKLGEF